MRAFHVDVFVLIALTAAIAVIQVQTTSANPRESWASKLYIEDPSNIYQGRDVWSKIPPELRAERKAISEKMKEHKLDEAIKQADALIKSLDRYPNRFEMLLFRQTIYMQKIKAAAMNGQFLLAITDGTRFSSYCMQLSGGCYHTRPIERLIQQVVDRFTTTQDPVELYGLNESDMKNKAKIRKVQQRAQMLLHSDKTLDLEKTHRDYLTELFIWANHVYAKKLESLE